MANLMVQAAPPPSRFGVLRSVVSAALLSMLVTVGVAGASPATWHYIEGTLVDGDGASVGTRTDFRTWWREDEVVSQIMFKDVVTEESRCEDRTYRHDVAESQSTVIRNGLSPSDCFNWAIGVFGPVDPAATGLRYEGSQADSGRRIDIYVGVTNDDAGRLLVDPATGLPMQSDVSAGRHLTWEYRQYRLIPEGPPRRAVHVTWSTESYTPLTIEELRARVDPRIPASFSGFRLNNAYVYKSERGGEIETAIWTTSDGRQVSLVRGPGVLDPAELGVQIIGDGVAFRAQNGETNLQIFAPDEAALRVLMTALDLGTP